MLLEHNVMVCVVVAVPGSFLLESKVLPDKPYQKQEVSVYATWMHIGDGCVCVCVESYSSGTVLTA